MPPNRNEHVRITEREWEALTRSIETLSASVERIEREQLVTKTKASVYVLLLGSIFGIVLPLINNFISHFVTKLLP